MERAQQLIDEIVSNPEASESNGRAYDLLKEYYRGAPVESLRTLLSSRDNRIAAEAAWIASELGPSGRPLLPQIEDLLKHPAKGVRFWSIDCILGWTNSANGRELATTIGLVDDTEAAVRWKAMEFLAHASREQLHAGLSFLQAGDLESPCVKELDWLLAPQGPDPIAIIEALKSCDARHRKFAAAAAYRVAGRDQSVLNAAASAKDQEIAQFARDMLKRLS